MGDPAGVGPEVIVGAWNDSRIHEATRPIVLGHPEIMRRAARLLKREVDVVEANADTLEEAVASPDVLTCIKACDDLVLDVPSGRVDPRAGEAAYQAVRLAASWALEKKIDGIVTAPLSKAALHAAGHKYPGHTELLAEICGVNEFAMMLYLPPGDAVRSPCGLGVAHVTLHQSMRSVFDDLTPAAIVSKCRLADNVMRRLGVDRPRIAVCALNPHAGEDGLFGDEEQTIIAPAVAEAHRAGIDAAGPFPDRHAHDASPRRRIRRRRRHVSRPGSHRAKTPRHARGREYHAGTTDRPHERRSRHSIRPRLARHRTIRRHGGGDSNRGQVGKHIASESYI